MKICPVESLDNSCRKVNFHETWYGYYASRCFPYETMKLGYTQRATLSSWIALHFY
jgi:hypothetical protein